MQVISGHISPAMDEYGVYYPEDDSLVLGFYDADEAQNHVNNLLDIYPLAYVVHVQVSRVDV